MSYRIIQNILDTQLSTVSNLPLIVKENEGLSRTSNDTTSVSKLPYLRTTMLPAETDTITVGLQGKDRFQGLYQVDSFAPEGDSHDGGNWITDEIIKAFPKKTLLTQDGITLRIVNHWRETALSSTQLHIVPIIIQWEAIIER